MVRIDASIAGRKSLAERWDRMSTQADSSTQSATFEHQASAHAFRPRACGVLVNFSCEHAIGGDRVEFRSCTLRSCFLVASLASHSGRRSSPLSRPAMLHRVLDADGVAVEEHRADEREQLAMQRRRLGEIACEAASFVIRLLIFAGSRFDSTLITPLAPMRHQRHRQRIIAADDGDVAERS